MTAAQMAAASDDNIVGLFEELVDATQWDHPRRRWTKRHGGSVPAAREFAAFAKNHPERALRILEPFQPGLQERPVGEAVAALGESEAVSAARLVETIRTLSLRGFTSREFRWHAARSLRALALREQGLDDATCELLEGWLREWEPPQPAADNDGLAGTHRHQTSEQSGDQTDSLLWGHGRSVVLPGGNYPILEGLTCGYLLRDPMAADQWLNVLQRHLSRREDPAVWPALAYDLRFLANAELGSALAFLERLFETQPSVLTEERGVMLIARIHDWLPAEMFARVIDGWITCGWSRGPQAAGEVATLRLCQRPEESEARELVESFIAGCDYDPFAAARLRLGIGHTLVQAWSEPPLRALSTPLLLRLLSFPDEPVTDALHLIFAKADPLPTDNHTRILLQSLLSCPEAIISHEPAFLVDRLKDLLRQGWELDLVCDVVAAILDHAGAKLNDLQGGWPGQARELVEIALTLHRMPETRARGLDLFEQLMDLDAYGVTDHLRILDRRPFR